MRKYRKRNRKKQQKITIFFSIILCIFCLSVGYSAFSTSITLNTKGIIKDYNAAWQLRKKVVSMGDGLYLDHTEKDRYVYKGTSPKNYIRFNNELWRIVSVEPDETIKIIRKDGIGTMEFDSSTNRNNQNNTFCNREVYFANGTRYWGCNVWGKVNGIHTNGSYSGTVTQDSTLNIYLNGEYLNTMSSDREYIEEHTFNVGPAPIYENILSTYESEKKENWFGKIGLITVSDYLKASINLNCSSMGVSQNSANCSFENGNYLDELDKESWTITPYGSDSSTAASAVVAVRTFSGRCLSSVGGICGYFSYATYLVRPVLFLKSNFKLKGDGTDVSPYEIK